MGTNLDRELDRLVIGTNDQRRRAGQALFHFYKTLIFWSDKDLSFYDSTRMWSAGGAAIFDAMAGTLRELLPHEEDAELRQFVADVLRHLADDLERGDHMRMSFVRWLEARFPDLTRMMQAEEPSSRIYDYALAFDLSETFARAARTDPEGMVAVFRAASAVLVEPAA